MYSIYLSKSYILLNYLKTVIGIKKIKHHIYKIKILHKINLSCVYPVPPPTRSSNLKWTNISDSENYEGFKNPALPKNMPDHRSNLKEKTNVFFTKKKHLDIKYGNNIVKLPHLTTISVEDYSNTGINVYYFDAIFEGKMIY